MSERDDILRPAPEEEGSSPPLEIPEELPMLPVRDVVVFPYMILPLFVGREKSVAAVEEALQGDRILFLATQKEVATEDPSPEELYETGTVAMIMRMLKLPDGRVKVLVQGLSRARRLAVVAEKPCVRVRLEVLGEGPSAKGDFESEALMRAVREKLDEIVNMGKGISTEIMMILENVEDAGRLAEGHHARRARRLAQGLARERQGRRHVPLRRPLRHARARLRPRARIILRPGDLQVCR